MRTLELSFSVPPKVLKLRKTEVFYVPPNLLWVAICYDQTISDDGDGYWIRIGARDASVLCCLAIPGHMSSVLLALKK